MTRIYWQFKIKDKNEPDKTTKAFYANTHFTKEEAEQDAQRRLTEGQTAEYVGFEFV